MLCLPATNDLKVILNALVVDELVRLKVRHGNLLAGPVGSSLSVGASGDINGRGDGLYRVSLAWYVKNIHIVLL